MSYINAIPGTIVETAVLYFVCSADPLCLRQCVILHLVSNRFRICGWDLLWFWEDMFEFAMFDIEAHIAKVMSIWFRTCFRTNIRCWMHMYLSYILSGTHL